MALAAAPAPRGLLFDIGRVIVRVDIKRALGGLAVSPGTSAEQIWEAIQADPRWRDWQEGRIAPRDWHQHLARRFGFPLSFSEFCAIWNSSLAAETILGDDLFAQLAPRCRLGLLSNTDPIHVAHLEANFSFVRHFPARVYSCTTGATKPNPAIYRRAISELGLPPGQVLYVDDEPKYVEGGRQAGIEAIVFTGAEPLLAELRRRGILDTWPTLPS